MQTTQHNHGANFGKKIDGCPRCTELKLGMPARQWANYRKQDEAKQIQAIRAHDCKRSGCNIVCTFGDF